MLNTIKIKALLSTLVVSICGSLSPVLLSSSLLVDPAVGNVTVLFNDSTDHDDEVVSGRLLGFVGKFFGQDKSTVDVSTNGNLNFSSNDDYFSIPLPTDIARIDPLWYDLYIFQGQGGSIIESVVPGAYYAVTYQHIQQYYLPEGGSETFQIVWFGSKYQIGNCTFYPGDIVFTYDTIVLENVSTSLTATIGLDKGDSSTFAPIPGTTDGVVAKPSQIPPLVLFRPNDLGNYDAQIGCDVRLNLCTCADEYLFQTDFFNIISWNPPSVPFDTTVYLIYRDGVLIHSVNPLNYSYSDHNLRGNTLYSYQVIAVNATGQRLSLGAGTIRTAKD